MIYLGQLGAQVAPSAPVSLQSISSGWRGTAQTINAMAREASRGGRDPQVRFIAEKIVKGVGQKNYRGECQALADWLRRNYTYRLDPRGLEWVQKPRYFLTQSKQGDCDDVSTAYAALVLAMGHEAGFRAVKADPRRPNEFTHVYAMCRTAPQSPWLYVDLTEPVPFGVRTEDQMRIPIVGAQEWVVDPEHNRALAVKVPTQAPRAPAKASWAVPKSLAPVTQLTPAAPADAARAATGGTQFKPFSFNPFNAMK